MTPELTFMAIGFSMIIANAVIGFITLSLQMDKKFSELEKRIFEDDPKPTHQA